MDKRTEMLRKGLFLDRDGVINRERGDYSYRMQDFEILPGVPEALRKLHGQGFAPIVITNQAGISKGIYTKEQMQACHDYLRKSCPEIVDIFYCPYHPEITRSLSRKPSTLLFERAICRFGIDPKRSVMLGDRRKDLLPAVSLGIYPIFIKHALSDPEPAEAIYTTGSLRDAVQQISSLGF